PHIHSAPPHNTSALHSFPTRRSSDLHARRRQGAGPPDPAAPARSSPGGGDGRHHHRQRAGQRLGLGPGAPVSRMTNDKEASTWSDRKSTRLNSSHVSTSYAVFSSKEH